MQAAVRCAALGSAGGGRHTRAARRPVQVLLLVAVLRSASLTRALLLYLPWLWTQAWVGRTKQDKTVRSTKGECGLGPLKAVPALGGGGYQCSASFVRVQAAARAQRGARDGEGRGGWAGAAEAQAHRAHAPPPGPAPDRQPAGATAVLQQSTEVVSTQCQKTPTRTMFGVLSPALLFSSGFVLSAPPLHSKASWRQAGKGQPRCGALWHVLPTPRQGRRLSFCCVSALSRCACL